MSEKNTTKTSIYHNEDQEPEIKSCSSCDHCKIWVDQHPCDKCFDDPKHPFFVKSTEEEKPNE